MFLLLLQIQNQLPGAIFPYVFYPIKLPKSITMDSGLLTSRSPSSPTLLPLVCVLNVSWLLQWTEPKPLTDISIVTRTAGHSDISRIK